MQGRGAPAGIPAIPFRQAGSPLDMGYEREKEEEEEKEKEK
jgi:hypothetical protein